ncbi:Gfo/Idh/MocA family protein [Halosimplex salinum]|uniref:Gfo/Idh/MocA family protein n=1 Tax=Halosimplex salinum TaxID=1710538 RepID=UPI000F4667B6|nr:Gfo/Idh/MocA family oxidoreductase [Halosimplex salinum]
MTYTAAVIGAGPDPENPSGEGYAMGYRHADGYETVEGVELVAVADIVPENARPFAAEYDIDDDGIFEDYERMLDTVEPDIVSVTVPPSIHADISVGCIRSGVVEAVHCEKPMSRTWGEARLMAQEADRHGVHLTFNHQRRFGEPFRRAKDLLDAGEVGTLERVEFSAHNVYDYGSHSFDLCSYYNDEANAEWVLANVDYREEDVLFGAHNENHAVVQWAYENGVTGLATTGVGAETVGCHNRLIGSEGVIEVGPGGVGASEPLRIRRDGEGWESVACEEGLHDDAFIYRGIEDVVSAVETGEPSELCARNALVATELIFGAWESARRRGRVDFPLTVDDNPLESMVESGDLTPEPRED